MARFLDFTLQMITLYDQMSRNFFINKLINGLFFVRNLFNRKMFDYKGYEVSYYKPLKKTAVEG